MKNRKLFAIITLVAFMLTMMPVMAFATSGTGSSISMEDASAKVIATDATNDSEDYLEVVLDLDGAIVTGKEVVVVFAERNGNISDVDYFYSVEANAKTANLTSKEAGYFVIGAQESDIEIYAEKNRAVYSGENEFPLYVVSKNAGTVNFKAYVISGYEPDGASANIANLYNGTADFFKTAFTGNTNCTGKFSTTNNTISAEVTIKNVAGTLLHVPNNATPVGAGAQINGTEVTGAKALTVYEEINANSGVDYFDFSLKMLEGGSKMVGEDVTISIDKNGATVNKEEVTTSATGKVDFKVSATKAGKYTVTVECGSFVQDFVLNFTSAQINKVNITNTVSGVIAVDNEETVAIQVVAYDVNGNALAAKDVPITDGVIDPTGADEKGFIAEVISAPDDSTMEEEVLPFVYNPNTCDNIYASFRPDAVGTYTIKVYSEVTGVSTTTTIEAAEFGVADHATISYASSTYALGSQTPGASVNLYDQNGVKKSVNANKKFSYTGLGVADFNSSNGAITFKNEKDYAGGEVVVSVVVNNRYAASTTLTVGAAPAALEFTTAQGEVGEEVTVNAQVVDVNGNPTAISVGNAYYEVTDVIAVVTERPAGANVSVDADYFDYAAETFLKKGTGKVVITSNKEGTVKANVVVELSPVTTGDNANIVKELELTTIYVTGVATVGFGEGAVDATGADDVVTFIIDTNTFIANDKALTSDVAPYIVDGRTFIPVRAFVEATGATVEYDAATQVVTIKGNGIDAQMTIGSNILTVNGETVVMDTAAAIKDGRTVLPVRYAGQAIGYNFECAYGANGAVTAVTMFK